MHRRSFLRSGLYCTAPLLLPAQLRALHTKGQTLQFMTVNGPLDAAQAGLVLSHEHVLVDFIGAAQVSPSRYNREEAFTIILPHLQAVKQAGCTTFIECTPAYIGRDVQLLQQLSAASGLHIISNTGYYGAAGEKFLPAHAYTETEAQLAARWISEWNNGIDGTSIKPGFIKTGVDKAPLSEVQQKLVKAAARTHLQTGLTIGIHTGDGAAAMQEMDILQAAGVDLSAWVWIHAQNETNRDLHYKAARAGGWVSFDGVNTDSISTHVSFLTDMKKAGLLHRALIAHDAGWYHVGETGGGIYRDHTLVFTALIPALSKAGFSEADIDQLFITNPAQAFAIQVRKAKK